MNCADCGSPAAAARWPRLCAANQDRERTSSKNHCNQQAVVLQ